MRSMFGWSYPPGVTGNEPEITGDYGPCEVCGKSVDDCICPECEQCHAQGDPYCYEHHGMVRNFVQIASRKALDREIELQEERDRELFREHTQGGQAIDDGLVD